MALWNGMVVSHGSSSMAHSGSHDGASVRGHTTEWLLGTKLAKIRALIIVEDQLEKEEEGG